MKTTISYSEACSLLDKHLKSPNLRCHSLGTAIAMRKIANALQENEEFWAICGLLHDLDMESIGGDLSQHGVKTVELLREEGYDIPDVFTAILAHTEMLPGSPYRRVSLLDFTLSGVENLQGFLTAYAMMRPSRSIVGAESKSVTKKLKDKGFANSVNREAIADAIEHSNLDRADFIQRVIDALSEDVAKIGM